MHIKVVSKSLDFVEKHYQLKIKIDGKGYNFEVKILECGGLKLLTSLNQSRLERIGKRLNASTMNLVREVIQNKFKILR
jgi:hypothetical protein